MNNFFLQLLEKFWPLFKHIAQLGSQFAQMVVHFAHFPVQARERSVLGWGWVFFVYVHIPGRGV